ncbi:receptor expression-enhancing protein 6-like [Stegodyphus dumicola]|uniref:receptor expression-enhancing protein 6-like n=1 Tax=Stegodyphus dumicola TaxID=202533 RepID=UPI0015B11566|nr:receptor expression-enhancing protein 6-like [Stegodyphus dumicola]
MPRSSSLLYYVLYLSIGIIYPAYCSFLAITTPNQNDDTVWLIYWIVFAVFNVLEIITDFLFFWIPLYPVCKLLFLGWCSAPIGKNGAYYLYKLFLEPFIHLYGPHVEFALMEAYRSVQSFSSLFPF